jgi:hypothetical protein
MSKVRGARAEADRTLVENDALVPVGKGIWSQFFNRDYEIGTTRNPRSTGTTKSGLKPATHVEGL